MLTTYERNALDTVAKTLHGAILNLEKIRTGSVPLRPVFIKPDATPKAKQAVMIATDAKSRKNGALASHIRTAVKAAPAPVTMLTRTTRPQIAAPVEVAKVREPKQEKMTAALLRKNGISHADLTELLGWPVGATYLDRVAARQGFEWWIVGDKPATRRYFAKRV